MKNVLLLSCLFFLSSCANTLYTPGYKQTSSINADGNLNDWILPLKFGSEDGKYQYSITYDDKNIYIALASFDPMSQMSILRSGIDFYFDLNGKKSKSIHLHYPEKKGEEFTIEGFQKLDAGTYSILDPTSIKAAVNADDQKNIGIELIIPKLLITPNGVFNKNRINIGIELGTFKMDRNSSQNGEHQRTGNMREGMNTGGFGGGMGSMRGGGMRGGMEGMRSGGIRRGMGAESGLIGGKQSINWNAFILQ